MNTVPICWICRDKANTCEHIFKKSLMKNTVGKQSYHVLIKQETGLDIDLTPNTPEKSKEDLSFLTKHRRYK